ncbi:hypothetical protein, partial [Streptomyces flavofungini]|uniref:hypothetical protein n=1 Tax=Streptomyces flavofungini TaxID=68200 RepID=UPI0034DE4E6F
PRQWTADEDAAPFALPVTPAEDSAELAARCAAEPFDLGRQNGWRAHLVPARHPTDAGRHTPDTGRHTPGAGRHRPDQLVFVKHHILADAWAQEVLRRELLRELTTPGSLGAPAPGPADLAAEQYGPDGLRRRRAAAEHWRRMLEQAPEAQLPASGDTPGGREGGREDGAVVQGTLRSQAALAGARALADRAGVSVASAVLAAYARAVGRRCGSDALLIRLMSANRFSGRWRDLVTSMNQWVPALVTGVDGDVGALARTAHWSSLRAVRHGMHDVREVAALRAAMPGAPEAACAFNHVAVPPADGTRAAVRQAEPVEPTVSFETPFTTIGPRCYARSQEDGHTLTVRLTARDIGRAECGALLWELHDTLLAA